jgi:Holliday junction DNA helicase RuvA
VIGRLRGTLVVKSIDRVVLEVSGVGYEIAVSARDLAALPGIGDEAVLHTHTYVREDALALYGFASEDQRELFRLLLGVAGVGPKVALAILSTMSPDELRRAVVSEDADALTAVPGIGKRSAQKLLLELRPRLELPDGELLHSGSPAAEVRLALEGLGYQAAEIREALAGLPQEGEVEDLLRESLRELGRKARGR